MPLQAHRSQNRAGPRGVAATIAAHFVVWLADTGGIGFASLRAAEDSGQHRARVSSCYGLSALNRVLSVDKLRVLAVTAVIALQTSPFQGGAWSGERLLAPGNLINQLSRFAVPFFFVVSGYFGGNTSPLRGEGRVGLAPDGLENYRFVCRLVADLSSALQHRQHSPIRRSGTDRVFVFQDTLPGPSPFGTGLRGNQRPSVALRGIAVRTGNRCAAGRGSLGFQIVVRPRLGKASLAADTGRDARRSRTRAVRLQ